MKCSECKYNRSVKCREGKFEIGCSKNGTFTLAGDYVEQFNCPYFEVIDLEVNPEVTEKKPNITFVLKSGRDIVTYVDNIETLDLSKSDYVIKTDDCQIKSDEVAAFQILL